MEALFIIIFIVILFCCVAFGSSSRHENLTLAKWDSKPTQKKNVKHVHWSTPLAEYKIIPSRDSASTPAS